MAHWAFRRLSGLLAREGFHVLRFDWSGTGDSWGHTSEGTVPIWLDDLAAAARELKDVTGASAISLVGRRFGATLAALASAGTIEVDTLVLWDPVVSGRAYFGELEDIDRRENTRLLRGPRLRPDELVGFPVAPELRRSVEEIDLRRVAGVRARRIALVADQHRNEYRELLEVAHGTGISTSYDHVPEDPSVTNAGQREAALLSARSLTAITGRLVGEAQRD